MLAFQDREGRDVGNVYLRWRAHERTITSLVWEAQLMVVAQVLSSKPSARSVDVGGWQELVFVSALQWLCVFTRFEVLLLYAYAFLGCKLKRVYESLE